MRFSQAFLVIALAIACAGLPAAREIVTIAKHAKHTRHKHKRVKKARSAQLPSGPLARALFGAVKEPAALPPHAIGFYAMGCLAGAAPLPVDGPAWQVMRLSRNRNWGHPELIALIKALANDAQHLDGWPGLLVGDIAQPRGGPMLSDHASHQVGLDADIWFTPMPARRLSEGERETTPATSMLTSDGASVDASIFTDAQLRLLRRAASYASVERIFVNPAIKKATCDATPADADRAWLHKVRAYWGHSAHFHMRIGCPKDDAACKPQAPLPDDDGCGQELTHWLAAVKKKTAAVEPEPTKGGSVPASARRRITLDQLPADCRAVLENGNPPQGLERGTASTEAGTHQNK
jgi:penicillin-insensitive murein endopeptidase